MKEYIPNFELVKAKFQSGTGYKTNAIELLKKQYDFIEERNKVI